MKRTLIFGFLTYTILLLILSLNANAVVLFYDNFEDGNLTDTWKVEQEDDGICKIQTTDPYEGSYHAECVSGLATGFEFSNMTTNFSTVGYSNVVITYWIKHDALQTGESSLFSYYNGSRWIVVEQLFGNFGYTKKNHSLSANNITGFKLKFGINASYTTDYVRVDNITVIASVLDITPPSAVVGLSSPSQTNGSIYWNWTNPVDVDFNHTEVWISGVWKINTTLSYYNATGLIENTSYTIGLRTTDNAGNINLTWINNTNRTKANVILLAIDCTYSTNPLISFSRRIPVVCRLEEDKECVIITYANGTILSTSPDISRIQGIGLINSFQSSNKILRGYYNQFLMQDGLNYSISVACGDVLFSFNVNPKEKALTSVPSTLIWSRDNFGTLLGMILMIALIMAVFVGGIKFATGR